MSSHGMRHAVPEHAGRWAEHKGDVQNVHGRVSMLGQYSHGHTEQATQWAQAWPAPGRSRPGICCLCASWAPAWAEVEHTDPLVLSLPGA